MKYKVDFKFSGYFCTEVEAENFDEAYEKAQDEWWNYSLGNKIEDIETNGYYMEDENGKVEEN